MQDASIPLVGQVIGQEEDPWRPLFDGATLAGWTPKIRGLELGLDPKRTFRVEDGAIVVSYQDYDAFQERFGHLFYRTSFSAFRLRLDYRFYGQPLADTPAWAIANSGVMIFSQDPQTMAVDQAFPVSVEAQLLGPSGTATRTNGNMCSPGTHVVIKGALRTQHCINSFLPAAANGEWVKFEIEVTREGEVSHFINGEKVMTYSGVQLDPDAGMANSLPLIDAAEGKLPLTGGYLALQSEGAPIAFRNIEIMDLAKP